jgi:hypothetical protein
VGVQFSSAKKKKNSSQKLFAVVNHSGSSYVENRRIPAKIMHDVIQDDWSLVDFSPSHQLWFVSRVSQTGNDMASWRRTRQTAA